MKTKLNIKTACLNIALALGIVLLSKGLYMDAKAQLAQVLIEHSWQTRNSNGAASKPWWWADTTAVATLEVPRLNQRLFVMQDDSGESLAFGPGHLTASQPISSAGHVMIAGHRDSHFEFLQHIKPGDLIETTASDNRTLRYRVTDTYVFNADKEELIKYEHDELSLITCYPFNSLVAGGPLRYVVNAKPVSIESKTPLVNQTIPQLQPKHYSKMPESTGHAHALESTIADI